MLGENKNQINNKQYLVVDVMAINFSFAFSAIVEVFGLDVAFFSGIYTDKVNI